MRDGEGGESVVEFLYEDGESGERPSLDVGLALAGVFITVVVEGEFVEVEDFLAKGFGESVEEAKEDFLESILEAIEESFAAGVHAPEMSEIKVRSKA